MALHCRARNPALTPYINYISGSDQIHMTDIRGRTLLHIAAMQGNVPFAGALLNKGPNPISVDGAGYTPLHFASRLGDVQMCKLFLSKHPMMANTCTHISHTTLHSAAL